MALNILGSLVAFAALVILIAPMSLYFAWAATHLWAWFVAPVFSVPNLTVLQAWGITLTLSMLKPEIDFSKSGDKDWASGILGIILAPLFALGFGYAIKFWWM